MTSENAEALVDRVRDALRTVIDPEIGYNIVDLGLVYTVAVSDEGAAHIVMTTTTAGCPATGFLKEGAWHSTRTVPGITDVDVELTYEPHWTPEMMSAEAKRHLGMSDGSGW